MAEWRTRNYVPDSDDDEENGNSQEIQSLAQDAKEPTEEGFIDIDGFAEVSDHGNSAGYATWLRDKGIRTGDVVARRKAPGVKTVKDITIEENQGVGDDLGRGRIASVPSNQSNRTAYNDDEVDELQQDHYLTTPAAQLAIELSKTTEKETSRRNISTPLQEPIVLPDALAKSPRLPSSPPVLPPYQPSSAPSSPLSEPPPTPPAAHYEERAIPADLVGRSHLGEQRRFTSPKVLIPLSKYSHGKNGLGAIRYEGMAEAVQQRSGRALRERNPIQLHPYALEGELYRQSLKARGLKPVRFVQTQDEEGSYSQLQESNTVEDTYANHNVEDPVDVLSSSPPGSVDRTDGQQPEEISKSDEEEFPDIDTIMRQPLSGTLTQGFKRRKTTHKYGRSGQRFTGTTKSPSRITTRSPTKERDRQSQRFGSVFDVPPSPSPTGSSSPPRTFAPATDGFRYPIGLTSTQLPTPITSSEPRRPTLVYNEHRERSEDVDIESQSGSEKSSAADLTSSENEEAHQLQKVRRKIRGVLPASWLKLDLKTQSKKPSNTTSLVREPVSPARKEIHRGVARPITALNHRNPDNRRPSATIEISDDSSSDRDPSMRPRDNSPINKDVDGLVDNVYINFDTDLPDFMEDNRIDYMLPPTKRVSTVRTKETNHQTKATQSSKSSRKVNNSLFRKHRGSHTRQSRISDHVTRNSRESDDQPRYSPPRLSILDVISPDKSGLETAPPFVRLAARTARSRLDAGRHSPSRKYIRLATNQDTAEVQETLRSWRAGSIISNERAQITSQEPSRTPLTADSGNRRLPLRPFEIWERQDTDMRESLTRKAKLPSIPIAPRKPRKAQTSLRTFLEQQNARSSNRYTRKKIPSRSELSRKARGIQVQILSSLQDLNPSRPALLESFSERNKNMYAQKDSRNHLTATTHTQSDLEDSRPILERFLQDSTRRPSLQIPKVSGDAAKDKASNPEISHQVKERIPRQGRKGNPRYLDTTTASFRQYSEPLTKDEVIHSGTKAPNIPTKESILLGLGPFGTQYTTCFDILPLPTGISFPKTTFLGSGQLCRSLTTIGIRDLDSPTNSIVFQDCHNTFDWGPWTDTVSSQLSRVIEQILRILRTLHSQDPRAQGSTTEAQEAISLQHFVIQYIAENLSFLDPIDRVSCLQRLTVLISTFTSSLDDLYVRPVTTSSKITNITAPGNRFSIQLSTRNLVIINQLHQIAKHELVQSTIKDEIQSLLATVSKQALTLVLRKGFEDIRSFLRSWRNLESLDWDDKYKIESAVVIYHIVKGDSVLMATFWKTVQNCIMEFSHEQQYDARVIDHMWLDLLTLLPLFEFDAEGILKTRQRYEVPCENWPLVKRLIEPILEVYTLDSRGQSPTYNSYFRAISGRCFRLIKDWGWRKCEVIIGSFFDFYARNNLAHLQHEECHGSPIFLEHLDEDSAIELAKEDRCFHVLLKIIGVGLRAMRGVYPSKKIRDIAWRLMPNHGRNHPKDEAVRQEDLDALRNHHDLLCTLYWASPPGFRPRLSVIQNLVDVESSHKEACQISIRAWSNLVRYQVSTTEPASSLEPFAQWHNDLIHQILRQHGSARTEVEAQAKSAESSSGQAIPHDIRENTIGRNQRQVESVLVDALISLGNAVESARDVDAARILLTTSLSAAFDLFDAKQPRINSVIIHALDVLLAFTSKFIPYEVNDDSQDFGDWSGFEDDNAQKASEDGIRHIQETMLSPMSRLMSNCFGADAMLDDTLLLKLVQTWVAVAQVSVAQGMKSWNDYLSPYGHDSWLALRDTEQTRKFTAYFLATLIDKEHGIYREYKTTFIAFWMSSLLERESLLKFQHMLTEAVLNADHGNPLLANLPFWADTATGRFVISASDFRERRLSLISCILSNMRESMDFSTYHNLGEATTQKHEYTDLLKRLMTTMKNNYQELGTESSIRGAYVDFVHAMVGFLQQHTADVCPIDRFFTDSSAFPLPATDPTYVVGRLRNYQLRLQDSRTPKQLSIFIQTVSERAAVDGQQRYLVKQMRTAISKTNERGDPAKPTLRSFLLQVIFSAYVESSFSTSCGWVLATPILQAAEGILGDIIQDIDGTSEASVDSVGYSMAMVLKTMRRSMLLLVDHSGLLEQPSVLSILRLYFAVTVALLPMLSYLSRLPFSTHWAIPLIRSVKSFAVFAIAILSHSDDLQSPLYDDDESVMVTCGNQLARTRSFTTDELQDTLKKHWALHNGRYYVIKGNTRREVVPEIRSFEEERESFLEEAQRFFEALRSFPALDDGEEDEGNMPRRSRWSGIEDCIF